MNVLVLNFLVVILVGLISYNLASDLVSNALQPEAQKQSDEAIYITDYIENGQLQVAREKTLVRSLPNAQENVKSYAGFITVNKSYDSNMFFWFFPAEVQNAPVFLWLQGGPGAPSLLGLFVENGPLIVQKDLSVKLREYRWTKSFSMLYIDNPVGAGFSYTKDEKGYSTDEAQVAENLHEALRQFFIVFNEYKANDLYLTGESYAGKFLPSLGYRIHTNNSENLNLKGFILGNAFIDPVSMLNFADHLYQVGLIDERQAEFFREQQNKAVELIKAGKYLEAFPIFDGLMLNKLTVPGAGSHFTNFTGLKTFYNILVTQRPESRTIFKNYLALPEVKQALHVGNSDFHDDYTVEKHMLNDILKSVKPWFEVMLNNYKVLLHSGQLDIIVAPPLTESFIKTLQWKYVEEYRKTDRRLWKVNPNDVELAGYVKKAHNFYRVIVRNAGHMVPHDQPRAAFDMVTKFVDGTL